MFLQEGKWILQVYGGNERMNIMGNEHKNEIHLTEIESKQLYVLLWEEITSSYGFWKNVGDGDKIRYENNGK